MVCPLFYERESLAFGGNAESAVEVMPRSYLL
jgi:hypothetical protein